MLARKIAFNVFFNSAAKVVSTALALVSIGFITRYLGQEGFGDYATVLAYFAFFSALADLGLYQIATREISRPDADERSIMGKVFTFRLVVSLAVFFLSPFLAFSLPYPQEIRLGIILAAAAFIFTSSYGLLNGIFQKNIAMNKVATAEVIGKVAQVLLVFLAVRKDWGFIAVILAFLIASIVNAVLVFLLSRPYLRFRLDFDPPFWKRFLRESAPMGASIIITFLYFKLDTILLSMLRSSAEVGIYNVAYKIIENLTFFPAMVVGLIFPLLARYVFSEKEKFVEVSNQTFKIFLILAVPIVIGALFLSDGIVTLIGGTDFAPSAAVLRLLVFSLFFIFFGNLFNALIIAGGFQKSLMRSLVACAAFNITANLIFIPKYSYLAAAAISALTELLVVAFTATIAFRRLGYLPRIANVWGIGAAAAAMSFFLYLFRGAPFFVLLCASSAVYFISLWATRAVTNRELKLVFSRREAAAVPGLTNEN